MLELQSIHEIFRNVKGVKNNMKNEDIECKTEYYTADIFWGADGLWKFMALLKCLLDES